MKALQIEHDFVPIGEFKTHASRILRRLREEGRSVVVTQHGRPAGVLVPTADYDRWMERERFVAAVNEGLEDAKAGRTVSDEELTAELDREFGGEAAP